MASDGASSQARQALASWCICLSDVPGEIQSGQLCGHFQCIKASQITSPSGDRYKWLLLLNGPYAVAHFLQCQPAYQLVLGGQNITVKIEQCIPCDIPAEWVDEFVSQGGLNHPPYPGYGNPFPAGAQGGAPFAGGPYNPNYQQYYQTPPQEHGQQEGASDAEGNTVPKGVGPGQGPGFVPGYGPGYGQPPWPFYGNQQHWNQYPQNPGAPPPYNSQRESAFKPDGDAAYAVPGEGYVSNVVSEAQDDFLHKIQKKQQKEEKRQSEEPKVTNMIKVSKLPGGTTKDALTFFFENRRKSGGGDTEDVDFDESDMTAIITFTEPDAVKRILQKLPMLFQDKQIEVEEFYPGGRDKNRQDKDDDTEDEEDQSLCTIEIKEFKSSTTDDTIQFYFENGRRSGGGDIADFRREEDVIYITFEDENIAKIVAERKHKVDNVELDVKVYVPPPPRQMYNDKVFIQGMNSDTTKDCLSNFLEAKSGACPTDIVYGEEDGTALVSFEETFDYEKLQLACKKRALEGSYLSVSKVPVTNCMMVYDLNDTTTQDTLEFYFENHKRSGGGDIEKIQLNKEEGTCLVYFKDHKVLDEVCSSKRSHTIDGQKLKLRVYHECLGQISDEDDSSAGAGASGGGGGRKFKQPETFSLDDADKRKVEFLKHSKSVREAVEKQLKSCHAKIQWPKSKTDLVTIDCLLTPDVKDCKALAKTWKKTATHNINQFFDAFTVEENTVLQEAWESVMEGLQSMTITHPEGIAVISEPDNCKIVLVGYKHIVKNVYKQVQDVIKKVGEDLDRKKQQMTEKAIAKYHQIRLLILTHFPDQMKKKYHGFTVKIDLKAREVTFEGLNSDINAAKVEMYEIFQKIKSSRVGQFSKEKIEFCDTPKVRDYIVTKLKKKGIIAVWEIESQRNISMYAFSDKDAVEASHIFQQSNVETPVNLAPESVYLLQSDIWDAKKREVESIDAGLVKIVEDPDNQKIIIFTTTENVGTCREMVEDFLTFNTISERMLPLSPSKMKFIHQHHWKEIEAISKELKEDQVKITKDSSGILIKGTTSGLGKAQQRIDAIIQKIVKKSHTFDKPGMAKYIGSSDGQARLHRVERQKKVVIDSSNSDDSDDFEFVDDPGSPKSQTHQEVATCVAQGGQRITVVKGDLTELDADVIVNAANKDLKHVGGLAKAMVNKGGFSIQKECDNHIRINGRLMEGDVFCSKSGSLKCKLIVHAVGPVWQNGKSDEEEMLREVIFKSMEECSNRHLRSIGIPAICSGIFGFPIKVATKAIAEAVKDFFKDTQDSSIKDVYLCDITDSTVSNFVDGLKAVFGAKKVQENKSMSFAGKSQWTVPSQRRGGRTRSFASSDDDDDDYGKSAGSCNIRIKIIKGQIAEQAVDAIVNTTSKDLRLSNGAVSASISKMAGPTMQQECNDNYPNGISHGDVAITSGGNLRCKKVFHGSLPGWDALGQALGVLKKFMNNCLEEADSNNFRSMAFPAMGTGNLGFPKDVVAKEMFQCVGRFSAQNTSSSIKEVRFVLYDKDLPTVKAFDDFEQKWNGGSGGSGSGFGGGRGGGRKTRRFGSEHEDVAADYDGNKHRDGGRKHQRHSGGNIDPSDLRIGTLELKVYQGDITTANTDAIINSTNAEIDLSRGAVAQAICKKGGPELEQEIKSEVGNMKKHGIAVTSSGKGTMPCKHIIHLNAENQKGWELRILESMKSAEKLKISTVAFPALGTGQGAKVSDIAGNMAEAIKKFESTCKHLKQVHIVIFQQSMVQEFQTELMKHMSSDSSRKPSDNNTRPKGDRNSKAQGKSQTSFTIIIYADSMRVIQEAIKTIEEEVKKEFQEKTFTERIIKEFSNSQKTAVYGLAKYGVEVKYDEKRGIVKLYGLTKDLLNASDAIHNIIRDAERNKQAGQEASLVSEMVKWHFIEITKDGTQLTEYPTPVNLVIERAYRESKKSVSFRDNTGTEYTVDFTAMTEFPTDKPNDTVQVIRRDLLKDTTFEAPSNWSQMNDKDNVAVVTLANTDNEYQTVIQNFKQSSGSNYNIVKVERIQNRVLFQQYVAKKKLMDAQNKPGHPNEHSLWHGTAGDAIDSINTYGFNRSYCGKNATAIGLGVYFAVNAAYSCQATYSPKDGSGNRHIYLCKVLTGEYTAGQSSLRVPPVKSNHILYDSVVNNTSNPIMYVIFNDTQAYPEYLITFK